MAQTEKKLPTTRELFELFAPKFQQVTLQVHHPVDISGDRIRSSWFPLSVIRSGYGKVFPPEASGQRALKKHDLTVRGNVVPLTLKVPARNELSDVGYDVDITTATHKALSDFFTGRECTLRSHLPEESRVHRMEGWTKIPFVVEWVHGKETFSTQRHTQVLAPWSLFIPKNTPEGRVFSSAVAYERLAIQVASSRRAAEQAAATLATEEAAFKEHEDVLSSLKLEEG